MNGVGRWKGGRETETERETEREGEREERMESSVKGRVSRFGARPSFRVRIK